MHRLTEWLRKWLPILVLVGVLLDLGISYVLIQQGSRSTCWDNVLDQAITHHMTKAEQAHLRTEALGCARL